ncbi:MAG TPA: Crp/Fnr family transcriptional regulator [Candidatus Acidoferrales bacterium]|jgi:CRP/FNR family cyclic AMP-dependent transcriptional regulator|nr:Crp/Fnr family transcriptional regulator [Candidatus Acidoferrales bacterium]
MPPRIKSPLDLQAFLAKVGFAGTALEFRNAQTVFSQGDPARALFYIQKGGAKLSVLSGHGKEAVIAILETGTFFGEGCLAGQRVRMATASAIGPSTMLRIGQKEMTRVLHSQHEFSDLFIRHMLLRNIRVEADLVDQLFNSSEKRLARALLLIAHYGNHGKPKSDIPKISQETLAEMIGTTRARVSFFMNRFRKLGFINYNGVLQVHPSLLGIVLHE